jgi:DNA end-binding protein Ku
MARPYWSGHIQISLVSFGVSLYIATEAKVNHLPAPKDEAPQTSSGKVINLMDALRKSVASDKSGKPAAKETRAGIGLVKAAPKSKKRKSA